MEDEKPREPRQAAVNPGMRRDAPRPHEVVEEEEDPKAEPGVRGTQGATLNPLGSGGLTE